MRTRLILFSVTVLMLMMTVSYGAISVEANCCSGNQRCSGTCTQVGDGHFFCEGGSCQDPAPTKAPTTAPTTKPEEFSCPAGQHEDFTGHCSVGRTDTDDDGGSASGSSGSGGPEGSEPVGPTATPTTIPSPTPTIVPATVDYAVIAVSNQELAAVYNSAANDGGATQNVASARKNASRTVYVPFMHKDYFTEWNSGVQIQNTEGVATTLTVTWYGAAGAVAATATRELAPYGFTKFWLQDITELTANDTALPAYSAVITSSVTRVIADVRTIGKTGVYKVANAYEAIPAEQGKSSLYIPAYYKNYLGYVSGLYIQNMDSEEATITLQVKPAEAGREEFTCRYTGVKPRSTLIIPPVATDCLFGGVATRAQVKVTSSADRKIGGVVHQFQATEGKSMAENMIPANTGGRAEVLQAWDKVYGGWISSLSMQNTSTSPTTIGLTYTARDGSSVPLAATTDCRSIAIPGNSAALALFFAQTNPARSCFASPSGVNTATVLSAPRVPNAYFVHIANTSGDVNRHDAMGAPAVTTFSRVMYFPRAYRNFQGINSGLHIKNTGTTAATVHLYYYFMKDGVAEIAKQETITLAKSGHQVIGLADDVRFGAIPKSGSAYPQSQGALKSVLEEDELYTNAIATEPSVCALGDTDHRRGDADHNCIFTKADYRVWRTEFKTPPVAANMHADFNNDKSVNALDFGIWLTSWLLYGKIN